MNSDQSGARQPPVPADDDGDGDAEIENEDATVGDSAQPTNPRKRKKSSRACDFCHVNHQPCDNAKPRCSYCAKHNKPCQYLRPQKKRGPAQGYRSSLHAMRESVAAWGAALHLVPSVSAVLEGFVRDSEEGRRLSRAIRDPQQQEFFIEVWQKSNLFKAFFGEEAAAAAALTSGTVPNESSSQPPIPESSTSGRASGSRRSRGAHGSEDGAGKPLAMPHLARSDQLDGIPSSKNDTTMRIPVLTPSPSHDGGVSTKRRQNGASGEDISASISFTAAPSSLLTPFSWSDMIAKDAARSTDNSFSQTLGPLGFAPNETVDDFLAMTFDPEPLDSGNNGQAADDGDASLGTEQDQNTYYELLMGKRFP